MDNACSEEGLLQKQDKDKTGPIDEEGLFMGENKNKGIPYYITTAIAYTSGKPHIGNTYEIVLADA